MPRRPLFACCLSFLWVLLPVDLVAATVPADYGRIATWWHRETGVEPRYDLVALTSQTYARAAEIDRPRIMETMIERMRGDVAALDVSDDIYVLRIRTNLSEYDPREGGFFNSLFSGAAYIPIENPQRYAEPDKAFAGGALGDMYELHFLNAPEFYLWPASEDKARSIMQQAGRNPNVVVEFLLQPIAAELSPPRAQARRVYGRILSARVEIGNAEAFARSVEPVAAADMPGVRAEALSVLRNPDDLTMAMVWHKIVDGPSPDWARMVSTDPILQKADVFARDDVEAVLIDQAKNYYDRIDPQTPFRFTVNADVGPYDMTAGEFPIRIEGTVGYADDFPYRAYPDDAARFERTKHMRSPIGDPSRRITEVQLAFENGGDLPGFPADRDLARAIGMNLRGQAEVTVRPVRAETWVSRDEFKWIKYLVTRIEGLRVTESASGKLLHEAAFEPYQGPIDVTERRQAAEGFEGVDPYTVEIRGLKLGMDEEGFTVAAREIFGAAGPDRENPAKILFRGGQGESGSALLDQERTVKSISYVRKWDGELTQAVYDATVTKYGVPGRAIEPRLDPRKRGDREAEMQWTTNAQRVGGFTGRVWYWEYQDQTTLFLDLEDRSRATYEKPAQTISLD